MADSRRLIQGNQTPYRNSAIDASLGREAHREQGGGPSATRANANAVTAGYRVSDGREAHLETLGSATPRGTVAVSKLQRLGALLRRDENLARKLAKNPRRALAGLDFISDRDKQVLAGIDTIAWAQLAALGEKPQGAGGKGAVLEGVTGGAVQLPNSDAGYDPTGAGDGFLDLSALVGAGGRPSPGSPWHAPTGPDTSAFGRGSDSDGSQEFGGLGHGRSLPRGLLPDGSDRGIDLTGQTGWGPPGGLAPPAGPLPPRTGSTAGWDTAVDEGKVAPPPEDYRWVEFHEERNRVENQPPAVSGALARLAAEAAAAEDAADEAAEEKEERPRGSYQIGPIRAVFIQPKQDPPPPPPKPDGSNPNPEDPRGPGPVGPWSRGQSSSRGAYGPDGRYAVPNDFDPRGPGPVGPWSRGQSRGAYGSDGRYAVPNDFDPRGPGPVGPWSRGQSRPRYGSYRGDAMPNPDADPGRGGPVGPAT